MENENDLETIQSSSKSVKDSSSFVSRWYLYSGLTLGVFFLIIKLKAFLPAVALIALLGFIWRESTK